MHAHSAFGLCSRRPLLALLKEGIWRARRATQQAGSALLFVCSFCSVGFEDGVLLQIFGALGLRIGVYGVLKG